jgi:hypothetical protein
MQTIKQWCQTYRKLLKCLLCDSFRELDMNGVELVDVFC